MTILDLISMPESKTLEFKERMPEPLAIAKTACAFANGGGGTILIGVADKEKTITGIDAQEIHILEEKIANIVYSMVEPTAAVHITIHNLEGKLILKIDVFPGSLKPYHLKNKGEIEGTYIRVGSTNRKADIETIEELRRQRMNISFDETSIIDATIEDLDVKKNVKRGAKIEGLYRIEEYEYPETAIREAVVNAVCHRDYSRKGADIKFAIFDDRIEITSPGGLLPQISILDLGTGVSELRNKIIGRIFNEAGLIEGWGTGIRRIRKQIEEKGLVPPEFKENNGFFKKKDQNPYRKGISGMERKE